MNKQSQLIAVILVIIIVALLGNKILNEILEALNLKDTKEEAREKAAEEGARTRAEESDYWKPNFHTNNAAKGAKLLTVASADAKCRQIYDAIGNFYDQPEKIEAAFNDLTTKSQISFLAYRFSVLYKRDLYAFLEDKMDTTKQKEIFTRILRRAEKLPDYR